MMNKSESVQKQETAILRRNSARSRYLLKLFSVSIGIVLALTLFHAQWADLLVGTVYAHELPDVKPSPIKIFNEKYERAGKVNSCDNRSFGQGSPFNVQFDYDDPTGQVTETSRIIVEHSGSVEESVDVSHEVTFNDTYPYVARLGDRFKGTIIMQWCVTFEGRGSTSVRFQFRNAAGAFSNKTSTIRIVRPEGAL